MEYYVYIYLNPVSPGKFSYGGIDYIFDYEPFYVGKGKKNRYKGHLRKSERELNYNPLKNEIFDKIELLGFNPIDFVIIFRCDLKENEAFEWEKLLISQIGRRDLGVGPLTNLTDGGEGGSGHVSKAKGKTYEEFYGPELAEKMREVRKERFRGSRNPMFGKKGKGRQMSDSARRRLSLTKSKPIIQMDLNGNFIREWDSVREASINLGINISSLNNCLSLNYRTVSAGGFKWEYKGRKNPKLYKKAYRKNQQFYKIIHLESGKEFFSLNLRAFCIEHKLSSGLFQTINGNFKQLKGYRAILITKEEYERSNSC